MNNEHNILKSRGMDVLKFFAILIGIGISIGLLAAVARPI